MQKITPYLWFDNQAGELISGTDAEKSARAVQCMFTMKKIDLAKIQQAYEHG
jgi:predicted 3-demethylubiquinone-9 3-methyltransferase (glyoxalase superfamily)